MAFRNGIQTTCITLADCVHQSVNGEGSRFLTAFIVISHGILLSWQAKIGWYWHCFTAALLHCGTEVAEGDPRGLLFHLSPAYDELQDSTLFPVLFTIHMKMLEEIIKLFGMCHEYTNDNSPCTFKVQSLLVKVHD